MIPKHVEITIQKAILKIENPNPKNDFVITYADFLKVRDYLQFYQFNFDVFTNLIRITNENWKTKERINRLSLLEAIKYYLQKAKEEIKYKNNIQKDKQIYPFPIETRKQMFLLLQNVIEESSYISVNQHTAAQRICSNILRDVQLTSNEEQWYCDHVHSSEVILNRLLRYPAKSSIISKWVKNNYSKDIYRPRRAEMLSWIIDEDKDFEIDRETLIADIDYTIEIDKVAIEQHKTDKISYNQKEEVFKEWLREELSTPDEVRGSFDFSTYVYAEMSQKLKKPELNLVKKHFSVYSDFSPYPDYIKTKKIFIQEIESNFKRIMAWGITYSRLNVEEKTELLKKYYTNNLIFTFKKIAERINSVELLKFILSQKDIKEDDSVHILEEKNDIVNENMSSGSYNDVPF